MWRAILSCWWWDCQGYVHHSLLGSNLILMLISFAVWLLYISTGSTMNLWTFNQTLSIIPFFLIQILFRLWRAVVKSCFLRSTWSMIFRAAPFFVFLITSFQGRMFCFGIIDLFNLELDCSIQIRNRKMKI